MKEQRGPMYVKSKEQFDSPEHFQDVRGDEFVNRESIPDINRRDLLKFVGGSLALAGLATGCRYLPQQKIVPFVQAPEDRLPGTDSYFATAAPLCGYSKGVLVRSYEGRPVKIEGNPGHPSSLGAIDSRTMAELEVMYDPDRMRNPGVSGDFGGWDEFLKRARAAISLAHDGAGVAILTQNVGSPTLFAQLAAFLKANPGAKWYQYEPINKDNVLEGAVLAFGQPVDTVYHFEKADIIVTLEADVFLDGPGNVRYQNDMMARRNVSEENTSMNRIYAIEGVPTLVGATADHRWRVKSSKIIDVVNALAAMLGAGQGTGQLPSGFDEKKLAKLAGELTNARGRSIVVAGEHQPAGVHALVHAINEALGNVGSTVTYIDPVVTKPASNLADIQSLATALESRQVSFLMILGGNPAYDAPADLKFGERIAFAQLSAHLSIYENETSSLCTWQLPMSHWLESWSDAKGHDGTASIVQPLINPIFDSKSEIEVIESLLGGMRTGLEIVQATWKGSPSVSATTFDEDWDQWLSKGVVTGSTPKPIDVKVVPNLSAGVKGGNGTDLELLILQDPTVYDGRYSNIGWMQELPKPLTNLTWDNTFQMSPATAKRLGVGQNTKFLGMPFYGNWSVIKVTANGKTVEGPVYVHYGMADDQIVVHLGYGRTQAGTVGNVGDPVRHGGGFDAYPLRTAANPTFVAGVTVEKTGKDYKLANTQFHNLLDVNEVDSQRDVIRETTLAEYVKDPEVLQFPTSPTNEPKREEREQTSIFEGPPGYNGDDQYQWAMTIDLNLCTGCNACVTACQSENNIPTVGKEQVLRHRMMHWIRIDRYYRIPEGKTTFDESDPVITFQPVACVQCEKAPCEPVCPVAATVHSHEGLNQMVYNRCVGTRYCSNNCPYKVRRFNYLHYTRQVEDSPLLKLIQNPDVTVRGRGVMEKCTYCVHRINHARIEAKKSGKEIVDGSLVTACQQACPSHAIIFGDKRRPGNAVSVSRRSNRNYALLEVVNTRPRTTHLGKVRNPNPEMEA